MGLLERFGLPAVRAAKVIDGRHMPAGQPGFQFGAEATNEHRYVLLLSWRRCDSARSSARAGTPHQENLV